MTANVTEHPCPTPTKIAYESRHSAKRVRQIGSKGKRMRAYLCPCGSWHLASWTKLDSRETA